MHAHVQTLTLFTCAPPRLHSTALTALGYSTTTGSAGEAAAADLRIRSARSDATSANFEWANSLSQVSKKGATFPPASTILVPALECSADIGLVPNNIVKHILPKVIWEKYVTTPTLENAVSHCMC